MIEYWVRYIYGMMGRSLDYMNMVMMSFVFLVEFFRDKENCFFEYILDVYRVVVKYDFFFIYIFIIF